MADKGKMAMWLREPWAIRALPFAVYMFFIVIQDAVAPFVPKSFAIVWLTPVMYVMKIAAVIVVLGVYRKDFEELRTFENKPANLLSAVGVGAVVFVLWINMGWGFATMGTPAVYDPTVLPGLWFYVFAAIRLFGTSVVVPIFEEIFWRSFILRYIVNPDFRTVRIGTFTLPSFLISVALFGAEHHLWLAGIMAGVFYNILLYKTKDLNYCIVAHGITNFLLGVYVLNTASWHFW